MDGISGNDGSVVTILGEPMNVWSFCCNGNEVAGPSDLVSAVRGEALRTQSGIEGVDTSFSVKLLTEAVLPKGSSAFVLAKACCMIEPPVGDLIVCGGGLDDDVLGLMTVCVGLRDAFSTGLIVLERDSNPFKR